MMTLGQIHQRYTELADLQNLHIDVLSSGDPESEIAIFAEAPGPREADLKTPLIGGSGQFTWSILRKYGINRNDVYVSNIVKRVLAKTRDQKEKISSREQAQWTDLVLWELAQLPNVKYVVLLGNIALQAFLEEDGITSWRGSVITRNIGQRDITFFCCFNPAHVQREPKWEIMFRMDLDKLNKVMEGNYKEYLIDPIINPSPTEAIDFMNQMQDEGRPISLDIETMSNETACVGLANDDHTGMCINFRDRTANRFTTQEEIKIWRRLQKLVGDEDVRLVMQNAVFDMAWLWFKDRIECHSVFYDTLLAHHTLYPRLPHNLGLLTTKYTTHPYYKDEKTNWKEGGDINEFWEYNVKDACIARHVWRRTNAELRREGLEDFFFEHVMRITPKLVLAECVGVRCDTGLRKKVVDEAKETVDNLLLEFHKNVALATGDETLQPNPLSHVQMKDLYFRKLKLVGRGTSSDKKNRGHMINNPRTREIDKEVILSAGKYVQERKFLGTFADTTIDEDNRYRTEYRQFGVAKAPGRLSSTATPWDTGGNFQNQPERARSLYAADPENEQIYFDLAQAEARYVGWDADIESWKEQFEKARLEGGFDCHRALCSEMFKIPYEETPEKDWDKETGEHTKRYIAKRCRHGLNYRMAPFTLAETTGLSFAEATKAYHLYHAITPELRKWWKALEREVKKNKMLFNAYGRRLYFTERLDTHEALESIVAFKPQSTIGDKTTRVMYMAQEDDKWPKGHAVIYINNHDSLTGQCKPKYSKTCLQIMKKYAEEPILVKGQELIIPADCKISVPDEQGIHRWSNLKDVEIAA